ncbi:hypothetical protein OCC_04063 [Thermococcus litoralis DSM 5473]|uniref:Cell wall-binding repeat 2 family protein n=1 Tax=Thermococcus litoralis (strain ATCC 51850 / DSM 5473 / JCM 8560 / NS-C) TaxID=523849 RepID=H3ZPG2_THELN|nr:hypothetical protein [Thermococcus litoralis]EHR78197.1 hypothetical protein OCC_04063 [Thermococcus litoralis DSM 5473]
MVAKKVLVWLFSALLLVSMIPTVTAANETSVGIVILVSNNEADLTLAQKLGESMNVSVIVAPWGVYDPDVTAEVISAAPDKVLIIGGPAAVPKTYEDDLNEMGISWVRIWGKDRYETNIQVLQYVLKNYPELLENVKIAIAHGRDIGAIKKVELEKAFPIYVDINRTENQTQILATIKVTSVVIIKTPYSENITERVRNEIRNRVRASITEEQANISAETAWEAIEIAENKTSLATALLENSTTKLPAAEKLLELANKEIEKAKEAYESGKYGEAYGQAIAAKAHAEAVIRMASEKIQIMMKTNQTLRIKIRIEKLGGIIERFESIGLNVTEEKGLLEKAKEAYEKGSYKEAEQLIEQLRNMLKEKFHEEKLTIREKWKERKKREVPKMNRP